MNEPVEPAAGLVIHSSWSGLLAAGASPVLLGALAVWAASRNPTSVITIALSLATVAAALVVLLDYPTSAEFSAAGVRRRCLLRRPVLPWGRIDALTRTSPRRSLTGRAGLRPGGLVAAVGRRRYLLTNTCESEDEFAALRAVLAPMEHGHLLVAQPPPDDIPPTWLYRRRRAE